MGVNFQMVGIDLQIGPASVILCMRLAGGTSVGIIAVGRTESTFTGSGVGRAQVELESARIFKLDGRKVALNVFERHGANAIEIVGLAGHELCLDNGPDIEGRSAGCGRGNGVDRILCTLNG